MPSLCSLTSLRDLVKSREKVLVVFTQRGCPDCPPFMKAVREAKKQTKASIVQVDLKTHTSKPCDDIIDKFKLQGTPTAILFRGGKEAKRLFPQGDILKDQKRLIKELK